MLRHNFLIITNCYVLANILTSSHLL